MDLIGTDCALARELISADLDGEVSELELHRLDAHLRVCADCSVWAALVAATTAQLRDAPLEAPTAAALEFPRRGRARRVGPALAIAPAAALVAAAAVVVALSGTRGPLGGQATINTRPSPAKPAVQQGPAADVRAPGAQHWAVHTI